MTIEEFNLKWLEYMNGVDLTTVSHCPNRHRLIVYDAFFKRVVTCPNTECDYYDYHTFQIAKDTVIAPGIIRTPRFSE